MEEDEKINLKRFFNALTKHLYLSLVEKIKIDVAKYGNIFISCL